MQPRPIDDQLYHLTVRYREFIQRFVSMQVLSMIQYRNNPNRLPASYYSMFLDLLFEHEQRIFTDKIAERIFYEEMQEE